MFLNFQNSYFKEKTAVLKNSSGRLFSFVHFDKPRIFWKTKSPHWDQKNYLDMIFSSIELNTNFHEALFFWTNLMQLKNLNSWKILL